MSKTSDTVLPCRREEHADVKQIALDLSRQEGRTVHLWEVLRLLVASYKQQQAGTTTRRTA